MDYFENVNIPISQKGNYLLISERKNDSMKKKWNK